MAAKVFYDNSAGTGHGTGDHKWSNIKNWTTDGSDGSKPVNYDTVTIDSEVTAMNIDEATTYISFNASGTLGITISGTGAMSVVGNFILDSNVTWTNTNSLTFYTAGNIDTGGVDLSNIGMIRFLNGAAVTVINNGIDIGSKELRIYGNGTSLTTNNLPITCGLFDDNGSATAVTLTLGSSTINCTNVSFAAATLTMTANTATINVVPTATVTLNTGGVSWGNATVNVGAASKIVNLGAALTHTGTFTHVNGTLDLKGLTLTTAKYASSNTNTRVLQDSTGGANIVVTGVTGTVFDMTTPTNLTVSNSPDVKLSGALTGAVALYGGGKTFGDFWNATTNAQAVNVADSNTFGDFKIDAGRTQTFTKDTTTTVTTFTADGTASAITIGCSTTAEGDHFHLSDASGTNTAINCTISRSQAEGGAIWATSGCTDGGNNTGWVFGPTMKLFIDNEWKACTPKIFIDGGWKNVASAKIMIAGEWKNL